MKLTPEDRKKWNKAIRVLKEKLPLGRPLKVCTRRLKNDHGYHILKNGVHHIVIDSSGDYHLRIDTLTHEYAHALDGSDSKKPHPSSWGVCYAKVYSVIEKEIKYS